MPEAQDLASSARAVAMPGGRFDVKQFKPMPTPESLLHSARSRVSSLLNAELQSREVPVSGGLPCQGLVVLDVDQNSLPQRTGVLRGTGCFASSSRSGWSEGRCRLRGSLCDRDRDSQLLGQIRYKKAARWQANELNCQGVPSKLSFVLCTVSINVVSDATC